MLRALVTYFMGWCLLALGASVLAEVAGATTDGPGKVGGTAVAMAFVIAVAARYMPHWPVVRQTGFIILPLLGTLFASWERIGGTASLFDIPLISFGAALGLLAAWALWRAPRATELSPALRALLTFIAGWCLLALSVALLADRDLATVSVLGRTACTGMTLVAIITTATPWIHRWPSARRADLIVLPVLGGLASAYEWAWRAHGEFFDFSLLESLYLGTTLGALSACILWQARREERVPDVLALLSEWAKAKFRAFEESNFILPPRLVSVFSLIQVFFIFAGTSVARWGVGQFKRNVRSGYTRDFDIPGFVAFASTSAVWFLLLTTIWCVYAVASAERGALPSIKPRPFLAGSMLTLFTVTFFLFAIVEGIQCGLM